MLLSTHTEPSAAGNEVPLETRSTVLLLATAYLLFTDQPCRHGRTYAKWACASPPKNRLLHCLKRFRPSGVVAFFPVLFRQSVGSDVVCLQELWVAEQEMVEMYRRYFSRNMRDSKLPQSIRSGSPATTIINLAHPDSLA